MKKNNTPTGIGIRSPMTESPKEDLGHLLSISNSLMLEDGTRGFRVHKRSLLYIVICIVTFTLALTALIELQYSAVTP